MSDAISQPYFSQLIQRTYGGDVGSTVQPVVSSLFAWTQERPDERPIALSLNEPDDAFGSVEKTSEKTSRLPFLSQPSRESEISSADNFSSAEDISDSDNFSRPSDFLASSKASFSTNTLKNSDAANADTSEFFEASFASAESVVPDQSMVSADAFGLFPSDESGEPAVLSQSGTLSDTSAESVSVPFSVSASSPVAPIAPLESASFIQSNAIQPVQEGGLSEPDIFQRRMPDPPASEQVIANQSTPEQSVPNQLMPEQSVPDQPKPEQSALNQITREGIVPSQMASDQAFAQQPTDVLPNVITPLEEPLHSNASENYTTPSIEPSRFSPSSEDIKSLESPESSRQRAKERMATKQDFPDLSREKQATSRQPEVIPGNSSRGEIITPALVRSQITAQALEQPGLTVTSLVQRSRSTPPLTRSNPTSSNPTSPNPARDKTSATAVINTITNDSSLTIQQPIIQPLTVPAHPTTITPRAPALEETTIISEPAPTVTVTIGRIEIRASQPQPPKTSKPKQRQPKLSLAQYLKQRDQNL